MALEREKKVLAAVASGAWINFSVNILLLLTMIHLIMTVTDREVDITRQESAGGWFIAR